MSFVMVRFLHDCGTDRLGEVKPIDPTRAMRLGRTGYIEIVDTPSPSSTPEAATLPRPQSRGIRPERRG